MGVLLGGWPSGVAAGVLSGAFGVGGGLVPVPRLATRVPPRPLAAAFATFLVVSTMLARALR